MLSPFLTNFKSFGICVTGTYNFVDEGSITSSLKLKSSSSLSRNKAVDARDDDDDDEILLLTDPAIIVRSVDVSRIGSAVAR